MSGKSPINVFIAVGKTIQITSHGSTRIRLDGTVTTGLEV